MNASLHQPPAGPLSCNQAPKGLDCCCCKRCGVGGCDLKILDCGCCFHTRCSPISDQHKLSHCPICASPFRAVWLMPMSFIEIDEAKAAAAAMALSDKRGKKRKNATIARLNPNLALSNGSTNANGMQSSVVDDNKGASSTAAPGERTDLRTGRWTTEETVYCDQLILRFETGQLPIVDGIKLNDFLANMLKSKQSRLTKKMKNARLSARSYKRSTGFILDDQDARAFSEAESAFFNSIPCSMEKAEIKFHMQKEWRELYSSYCVAIGQKLDADAWLSSVEELDRRASQAKDAARMARRKLMMGYALSKDTLNAESGVFIEPNAGNDAGGSSISSCCPAPPGADDGPSCKKPKTDMDLVKSFSTSPFVGRVVQYLQRYNIPFEHVDAWVPSFVPQQAGEAPGPGANTGDQKCRLCFAGSATTKVVVPPGGGQPIPLSPEEHFDLVSFGEYSQKFSFDLGCGLPGRVYSSGVASWEQGVQKAPSTLFERCGGAAQWDIQTVLGIPVPSPNVGRIVLLLYSRHDRERDQDMVNRISAMLAKLTPTPKWKLVVDVGAPKVDPQPTVGGTAVDLRPSELLSLIRQHMPNDKTSPLAAFLPGFTSLSLLLQKQAKTMREEDFTQTIIESFSSYKQSGRSPGEIASLVARDYMILAQNSHAQSQMQPTLQQVQAHQLPQQQRQLVDSYSFAAGNLGATSSHPGSGIPQQMFQLGASMGHPVSMASTGQAQQQFSTVFQQFSQSVDAQQQTPGQPSA